MIVAKTTDPNGGKGGAVLSIPEFMDTCELDRTTMFRLLKEGMPYRRTKSHIVIDFEKAREWISERGLGRPESEEDISDIAARVKGFISAKIRENKPAVIAALFSLITVTNLVIIVSLSCKLFFYKETLEGVSGENEFLRAENAALVNITERYSSFNAESAREKAAEAFDELKKQFPNVPLPALSLMELIDAANVYGNSIISQTQKDREKVKKYLERESFTPRGRPVEDGEITSHFGARYSAPGSLLSRALRFVGWKRHEGIDIAAPLRTPVYATASGRVIYAGKKESYGTVVIIDHGGIYQTRYGHLSHIAIREGSEILRGDMIGGVGDSGAITGPHLHYEVRIYSRGKEIAVNPLPYL